MHEDHVEIHVRSVFLQGVLIEEFKNLPKFFYSTKTISLNLKVG